MPGRGFCGAEEALAPLNLSPLTACCKTEPSLNPTFLRVLERGSNRRDRFPSALGDRNVEAEIGPCAASWYLRLRRRQTG
jgi:hypothetical protein